MRPYYPQSDNVSGTVVTPDANRTWQVAPRLNDRQFRDRQRVSPSSTDHAQLKKLLIIAHLSRTLRAFDTDIGEQSSTDAAQPERAIRCKILATVRRDLGNTQQVSQKFGSAEARSKELDPAHQIMRDG